MAPHVQPAIAATLARTCSHAYPSRRINLILNNENSERPRIVQAVTHLITGPSYTYGVIQVGHDTSAFSTRSTCAAYLYIVIGINYEVTILAKEDLDLPFTSESPTPTLPDESEPTKFDVMPDRTVAPGTRKQLELAGTGTMDQRGRVDICHTCSLTSSPGPKLSGSGQTDCAHSVGCLSRLFKSVH